MAMNGLGGVGNLTGRRDGEAVYDMSYIANY